MRVLVAEDDPISQRILMNYLAKWGYAATLVGDGREAWEAIQQRDYPIVICDWVMPGMNGVELVRKIRDWKSPWGGVYAILLTGKATKEDLVAAFEAGADDFVSKPFDRDELRIRLQAGARIVEWDREVQCQATEIVSQLDLARRMLQSGRERGAEAALKTLEDSHAALEAAYLAARRLERTVQPGDGVTAPPVPPGDANNKC